MSSADFLYKQRKARRLMRQHALRWAETRELYYLNGAKEYRDLSRYWETRLIESVVEELNPSMRPYFHPAPYADVATRP